MPRFNVDCHAVWDNAVTDALSAQDGIEVYRGDGGRFHLRVEAEDEGAAIARAREVSEAAGGNASDWMASPSGVS
jgi:hypothetical protein